MKKLYILFLPILIVLSACESCEEVGPTIVVQPTDRKVVIEEFTGVQCVQCPGGSQKIQDLIGIHGDKLIAISIHSGGFSTPYPESKYDFRTTDGSALDSYLGPVSGYPLAVVNRKWFDGQDDRTIFLNDWAGFIAQELQEAPKVRLDVSHTYNVDTRQIDLEIEIFYFEEVLEATNITALITENNIKDYQLNPAPVGKIADYSHKYVLRDILSNNYRGDLLGTNIAANTAKTVNFTYTLPNEWNAKECDIVVFVNMNDGNTLDILQAESVDVTDD